MTRYLIVRTDHGRREYVASPQINPTGSSYTRDIRLALLWPSQEEAARQACSNEHVVPIESELHGGRP